MNKNNFWILTSISLLLVIIVTFIPGDALAETTTQEAVAIFSQVFRFIQNNYVDEVDAQTLLEGALSGLIDSLDDPHSAYLNELALRDLDDTTTGKFGGVGMYISKQQEKDGEEAYIEIIAPIEGTPSDRLGIRAGDVILEIEGNSTVDMDIEGAVKALRGRPGTKVNILIQRGTRNFPIAITRAVVEVPTTREALIPEYQLGYIRIIQFTPFTVERVKNALELFQSQNYQGLIVDVRQNPGGLLSSATESADLFLERGLIVGTSGRNPSDNQEFLAKPSVHIPSTIPVVVLIDKGSASASEIFAGALGDVGRATIVGEQSYGKGSVQQIRRIQDGGIRLTMSRYYTPNGSYIDGSGITPDIEVESNNLTEEQIQDYTDLLASEEISDFVNGRTAVDQQEIDSFLAEIQKTNSLSESYLQKLVRDEINYVNNTRAVYDLEFDLVLQRAVELF